MLPRKHRLIEHEDFARTLRRGGRGGNRFLVVAVAVPDAGAAILHAQNSPSLDVPGSVSVDPVRVGFIVAKREMPHAVDRNRAKRQLRHLMAARLGQCEPGTTVVIRVLAPAKGATSAELGVALDRALGGAIRKAAAASSGDLANREAVSA